MANKRKKYNAKFPPARVKKIMQKDEEVGKVAAAVPVIIARALEFFVMDLMSKANERILSKNAKTLTPEHIKQTVNTVEEFSFLKELVAPISEVQSNNSTDTQQPKQTSKLKHEAKQEMKKLGEESSSSSFSLNPDKASHFKVPTRGRPKKVKANFEEISPKNKKLKLSNYLPLQDQDQESSITDVEPLKSYSLMLKNPSVPVDNSNPSQNPLYAPSPQSSFPLSSLPQSSFSLSSPRPSFSLSSLSSSTPTHILFQPSLDPIFISNSQLSTSNKIADALQAINNNNPNSSNINSEGNINLSSILNNANILNYNNNLITGAFNNNYNTTAYINNDTSNYTTNDTSTTNNNNSTTIESSNTFEITNSTDNGNTNNDNTTNSTHFATDLSQSTGVFSHLDEVLDLSKQSTNQSSPSQMNRVLIGSQQLADNYKNANNTFANTTSTNNDANTNNSSFNKVNNNISNNSNNNNIIFINNNTQNRQNDIYKLNVPNVNSFYHRSSS